MSQLSGRNCHAKKELAYTQHTYKLKEGFLGAYWLNNIFFVYIELFVLVKFLLHNLLRLLSSLFLINSYCFHKLPCSNVCIKNFKRKNRILVKLIIFLNLIKLGYSVSHPSSFISGNCKNWIYYLREHFKLLKKITSTVKTF